MFENFKSDIIYYNTQTDFELEFNLCGCCRKMRLLHDKCSDKKTLLLSLSRAVSRSRIIIITAPLFSEEKIINTVAAAIGSNVEVIDNSKYNIKSDSEITIIQNSVPLITSDGIFGGCVIESGPQALILVTDNKDIRKSIMTNLIHPYIMDFVGIADNQPANESNTSDEIEDIILETEEDGEETAEDTFCEDEVILETEEEPDLEKAKTDSLVDGEGLVLETEDETDAQESEEAFQDDEHKNLIIDTSSEDDSSEEYEDIEPDNLYSQNKILNLPEIVIDNSEEDYDSLPEDDEDEDGSVSPISIFMIIVSVLLLISLAVLCYCIFYVPTKAGIEPVAYLKDIFDTLFG